MIVAGAGRGPGACGRGDALCGAGGGIAARCHGTAYRARVRRPGATRSAPLLGPMCEDDLLLQLRHAMETEAVNADRAGRGRALPGARLVTIAFADLVGFTRLGEVVPPEDAGESGSPAMPTSPVTWPSPPVRFIKTIGDAVMFVSTDPVALLDAVLDLVDAAETSTTFRGCGSDSPAAGRSAARAIGSAARSTSRAA